jgi:hypothetical protein
MINIKPLKYDLNDNKTHMEKENFYNSIDEDFKTLFNKNTPPTKYILTNGANKEFTSGLGGTNKAITELGKKINNTELFFNHDNIKLFFDSNDIDLEDTPIIKKIIENENQKINFKDEKKLAGSVFLSEPFKLDKNKNKKIYSKKIKVFHINGINWKNAKKENEKNSNEFVEAYYKSILDYFFNEKNDDEVLHLIQTPGFYFGGTYYTTLALIKAIKEKFIKINEKNIKFQNNKLLTIDIDFTKNIGEETGEDLLYDLDILIKKINTKLPKKNNTKKNNKEIKKTNYTKKNKKK